MKFLTFIMIVLLILLQYRLWNGTGSLSEVNVLKKEIQKIKSENEILKERNLSLTEEVVDLKERDEAIEEIARSEMGMIKDGETFYQIIDNSEEQSSSN
jgi:cell division protein FtsB|tara:strand:+ start:2464 stop:2760 length:297 start_codon:yes stop_codon:yes gene_type:complete